MLTIRCDGREIKTVTTGSRDVLYQDRTFRAPFRGEHLTEATSPLYRELAGIVGYEAAVQILDSLPAEAAEVTIRDEYAY
jgi:hypothetical protein